MPTQQALNRADFIKRLFAVIVSVGFANQLIQMDWVKQSRLPSWIEVPHILFLALGLFLILQSWDGYFVSLENRPLEDRTRFYIDTVIVLTYLLLLSVSSGVAAFLLVICIIFALYIIWDLFTFWEYHDEYGIPNPSLSAYAQQLKEAARGRPTELRHKLSTIVAFLWFLEIYGIYLQSKNLHPVLHIGGIWLATFIGLLMYRSDQARPQRLAVIIVPLLIGAAILIYVGISRWSSI